MIDVYGLSPRLSTYSESLPCHRLVLCSSVFRCTSVVFLFHSSSQESRVKDFLSPCDVFWYSSYMAYVISSANLAEFLGLVINLACLKSFLNPTVSVSLLMFFYLQISIFCCRKLTVVLLSAFRPPVLVSFCP